LTQIYVEEMGSGSPNEEHSFIADNLRIILVSYTSN
jgi:hypothetical protein